MLNVQHKERQRTADISLSIQHKSGTSEEDALSGVVRAEFSSVKNWAQLTNELKILVQIAQKK